MGTVSAAPGSHPEPSPAEAVRLIPCPVCHAAPGLACLTAGDHMARYVDAYTAGLVDREVMARVFSVVLVITRGAVVAPAVAA